MTLYVVFVTSVVMSALVDPKSKLLIEVFSTLPVNNLSNAAFRQLCEAKIEELYSTGQIEHRLWVAHEVFESRPHSFSSDD